MSDRFGIDPEADKKIRRGIDFALGIGLAAERNGIGLAAERTGEAQADALVTAVSRNEARGKSRNQSYGAGDLVAEQARISSELHDGERVDLAITVFKPVDVTYSFWRDFSNFPKFMTHVKAIDVVGDNRMRWHWRTIGGFEMQWDAELIDDVPDKLISWRTLAGSAVQHAGSVWFKPALADEATEVYLKMMYRIPGGKFIKGIAELFGEAPEQFLRSDLKRFRCLLEAGEIH